MIDRYALFKGLYKDEIVEHGRSSIVLVDYKANKALANFEETCFIKMDASSITVEG